MTEMIIAVRAREVDRSNISLNLGVDIIQDGLLGKRYQELKKEARNAGSSIYFFLLEIQFLKNWLSF